jgi:large subunit ribosomal protein L24
MKIKKDDVVWVISGKEKGKKGKVQEVDARTGRVAVEGLNLIKRHMKRGRSKQTPLGGIIEKAGTIHVSNLAIYCKKCDKGVNVGNKADAEGKKIRYCKKCGEAI